MVRVQSCVSCLRRGPTRLAVPGFRWLMEVHAEAVSIRVSPVGNAILPAEDRAPGALSHARARPFGVTQRRQQRGDISDRVLDEESGSSNVRVAPLGGGT